LAVEQRLPVLVVLGAALLVLAGGRQNPEPERQQHGARAEQSSRHVSFSLGWGPAVASQCKPGPASPPGADGPTVPAGRCVPAVRTVRHEKLLRGAFSSGQS